MGLRSMVRQAPSHSTILILRCRSCSTQGMLRDMNPPGILSWCEVVCGSFQVLAHDPEARTIGEPDVTGMCAACNVSNEGDSNPSLTSW